MTWAEGYDDELCIGLFAHTAYGIPGNGISGTAELY